MESTDNQPSPLREKKRGRAETVKEDPHRKNDPRPLVLMKNQPQQMQVENVVVDVRVRKYTTHIVCPLRWERMTKIGCVHVTFVISAGGLISSKNDYYDLYD